MKKIPVIIAVMFLGLLMATGCADTTKYTASGKKMSTYVSITIYGGSQEIADEALNLCDYYEDILSARSDNSLLAMLNETGSLEIDTAEKKVLSDAVRLGLEYESLTEGALCISLWPLTSLWNFGEEGGRLPTSDEIKQGLLQVGSDRISVTDSLITTDGAQIDLGALAKGYIADRIKDFLLGKNVTSGIISLGGNVLCIGEKPDGKAFTIGIRRPFGEENDVLVSLKVKDLSVVTSGVYERYFYEDGVFYHHILNPDTGYPCDNGLLSVTIIAENSAVCDCLSTGCFVLGLEDGLSLVDSIENVYAIFVDEDYNVIYSDGAKDFL